MLDVVGAWPAGEALGLDFETTGIDRFNDVSVSSLTRSRVSAL